MRSDAEIRRINKSLHKMYDDVSDKYVDKLKELEAKNDEELRTGVKDIIKKRDLIKSWDGTQ